MPWVTCTHLKPQDSKNQAALQDVTVNGKFQRSIMLIRPAPPQSNIIFIIRLQTIMPSDAAAPAAAGPFPTS